MDKENLAEKVLLEARGKYLERARILNGISRLIVKLPDDTHPDHKPHEYRASIQMVNAVGAIITPRILERNASFGEAAQRFEHAAACITTVLEMKNINTIEQAFKFLAKSQDDMGFIIPGLERIIDQAQD